LDSCAPEVMVPDARVFSSMKNAYSRVHCNDTVLVSCTLSYSRVHCNAVIFLLVCIWGLGPL
jgi:hypothetical protein